MWVSLGSDAAVIFDKIFCPLFLCCFLFVYFQLIIHARTQWSTALFSSSITFNGTYHEKKQINKWINEERFCKKKRKEKKKLEGKHPSLEMKLLSRSRVPFAVSRSLQDAKLFALLLSNHPIFHLALRSLRQAHGCAEFKTARLTTGVAATRLIQPKGFWRVSRV